jgi:hypothetical protein
LTELFPQIKNGHKKKHESPMAQTEGTEGAKEESIGNNNNTLPFDLENLK